MEKLAICTLNHKGGVGKSTVALIMAQTAAMMKLHVLCIDLDEQKNLTDAMSLVSKQFSSLVTVKDHLDKNDAELDFDLFVIDCPPKLDKATASAIAFAAARCPNPASAVSINAFFIFLFYYFLKYLLYKRFVNFI